MKGKYLFLLLILVLLMSTIPVALPVTAAVEKSAALVKQAYPDYGIGDGELPAQFSVTTGDVLYIDSSFAEVSGNLTLGPHYSAYVSFEYYAEGETEYAHETDPWENFYDGDFPELLGPLASGTTYYYRAKAAVDGIDPIYGGEKSFTTETFNSAAISPSSADYLYLAPHDVSTTITWNEAKSVWSVYNEGVPLAFGGNYELTDKGDTALLTIRYEYLDDILTTENQTIKLDIVFDEGDPAEFLITAVDPTPPDASISPTSGEFDLYQYGTSHTTINADITWNRAHFIKFISDATGNLTLNDDYSITDNKTLKILPAYLDSVLHEEGDVVVFDIHFDIGAAAQLTITAIDTTPEDATIDPTEAEYVLAAGDNVTTEIA